MGTRAAYIGLQVRREVATNRMHKTHGRGVRARRGQDA
jgi:hypothetical protein